MGFATPMPHCIRNCMNIRSTSSWTRVAGRMVLGLYPIYPPTKERLLERQAETTRVGDLEELEWTRRGSECHSPGAPDPSWRPGDMTNSSDMENSPSGVSP